MTTGRPVASRASARMRSPSSPSPWKEYGLVRGLKAPPRRMCAPAALMARATMRVCSIDSTAQGPATIVSSRPPTGTSPTLTMLSSVFTSRETSL